MPESNDTPELRRQMALDGAEIGLRALSVGSIAHYQNGVQVRRASATAFLVRNAEQYNIGSLTVKDAARVVVDGR